VLDHSLSRDMIDSDDARLRLIAITDDLRDGTEGLLVRARSAEQGGVTMVLLRLKHVDARTLVEVGRALTGGLTIPVLVSERLDVALACGAAGVHVTSASMPVMAIRSQVDASFLIGGSVSVSGDVERAVAADFVTIGPVHGAGAASIGVDGFAKLATACARPAIAIGGIDAANVAAVREAGAAGVAAIRGIFAADDPSVAAAQLLRDARYFR
jgi:thiamine-phosphate pyrophosphorylase